MNDALQRLQEKIAYLERHVGEQDKAMLEMAERIDRLKRELTGLRDRMPAAPAGEVGGSAPAGERPPHY
jgi:SlyX protein